VKAIRWASCAREDGRCSVELAVSWDTAAQPLGDMA